MVSPLNRVEVLNESFNVNHVIVKKSYLPKSGKIKYIVPLGKTLAIGGIGEGFAGAVRFLGQGYEKLTK